MICMQGMLSRRVCLAVSTICKFLQCVRYFTKVLFIKKKQQQQQQQKKKKKKEEKEEDKKEGNNNNNDT